MKTTIRQQTKSQAAAQAGSDTSAADEAPLVGIQKALAHNIPEYVDEIKPVVQQRVLPKKNKKKKK